jgi:hypothetical protein
MSHVPPGYPVESAAVKLLLSAPDRWAAVNRAALTAAENEVLGFLVAAGLIEMESRLRWFMAGQPTQISGSGPRCGMFVAC